MFIKVPTFLGVYYLSNNLFHNYAYFSTSTVVTAHALTFNLLLILTSWHIGAYIARNYIVAYLPRIKGENKIIVITGKLNID